MKFREAHSILLNLGKMELIKDPSNTSLEEAIRIMEEYSFNYKRSKIDSLKKRIRFLEGKEVSWRDNCISAIEVKRKEIKELKSKIKQLTKERNHEKSE